MRKIAKEKIQEAIIISFNAAWTENLESTDSVHKVKEMCKLWKEKTLDYLQEKYGFSVENMSKNDREELQKNIKNGMVGILNFFVKN